jgi:hypothetical protein
VTLCQQDGITFALTTYSNNYGSAGMGLGYQGLPQSVAVEFDTYNNGQPIGATPLAQRFNTAQISTEITLAST